jgi:hypothetical protein
MGRVRTILTSEEVTSQFAELLDDVQGQVILADREPLTLETVDAIADKIRYRMDHFEETWDFALRVILFNYGSERTGVQCISAAHNWSGTKADLSPRDGVPHCPGGHVMTETDGGWRLELVNQGSPP